MKDKIGNKFPSDFGYYLPAEWSPHTATWIAWPHYQGDWAEKFSAIPWVFTEVVRLLSTGEKIRILVNNESHEQEARKQLTLAHIPTNTIDFFHVPTDRAWVRDFSPLVIHNSTPPSRATVKWRFTGWARYDNYKKDEEAGKEMVKLMKWNNWTPQHSHEQTITDVVLEGGSIDVNGKGTLLTTIECLLSKDMQVRNPHITQKEYEDLFAKYLGVNQVLWLPYGIEGDDTHGHIDDVARFVNEGTIAIVVTDNRDNPNYQRLRDNLLLLEKMRDQGKHNFEIVQLPLPNPIIFDNILLPASYANFYIGNKVVLVPTFNDPNDKKALTTLSQIFIDRDVIGVYAGDLIRGFGAFHCLTQQEPA